MAIRSSIENFRSAGCLVKFIWIPSHVNISGNEAADHAAFACLSDDNAPVIIIPLLASELRSLPNAALLIRVSSAISVSFHQLRKAIIILNVHLLSHLC